MAKNASFKLALIGTGNIAQAHATGFGKLPGVEVVAGCDTSQRSREAFAAKFPGVRLYATWAEMFKAERELAAVSICTPNSLHCDAALAALAARLHVLVEKPMAMDAKQARRMVAAAAKARRHLTVGFQWRFDHRTRMIRSQVDAGEFGKVLYVRVQALRRRGIPNWGVFGRKDLQGGGPLIDIGVHCAEMAHYMMGSPQPVAASGGAWTYLGDKPTRAMCMWPDWDHRTYTVEDLAVGMVRFANGAMMAIETSFAAHIEKDEWNVQIMGEKGGAVWDTGTVFKDAGGYMWNMRSPILGPPHSGPDWEVIHDAKMRNFVAAARDGAPDPSDGAQGLMVQQILDGIYASAAAGREVAIRA